MEFNLFRFYALLSVAFVASHAARTFEDYWRSVLSDTPMPKSSSGLLQSPEWMNDESKVSNVEKQTGDRPIQLFICCLCNQLHNYPNVALFFLEKDMHQGAGSKFSVKKKTLESETIKDTISECEAPRIKGQEKYCATSLEKMIDFYKQNYAYVVFYCHKTNNVKAYTVFLVGNDGTKAKAAAICHTDTSSWNPKHLALQVLNVKPENSPVCHFLPKKHAVWVPY